MTEQNYYIAYYQAIIEKNISKAAKLYLLSDKEQSEYPDEYQKLSYSNIFQSKESNEVIYTLLLGGEYKEFYSSLLSEIKNISSNYYIACYQALLKKDTTKLIKLDNFSYEDKINYYNEYPDLNYDNIFTGDPDVFLISMIGSNKDYYSILSDINNPLANEDSIRAREANYIELMTHPLIDYCPDPMLGLTIIDNLASISYSNIINKTHFKDALAVNITASQILAELFSTIAISATTTQTLSIAFIGDDSQEFDPTHRTTRGYYDNIKNTILIANKDQEIDTSTLAHEFTHKLMSLLFYNQMKPYTKNSIEMEANYHLAIKNTLLNIRQFIQEEFYEMININEQDDTWKIGQKLATIFSPLLKNEEIKAKYDIKSRHDYKLLQIIKIFLFPYIEYYDKDDEDAEFFVKLPEAIAAGVYYGKAIDILTPLAQYWQEVISPAIIEYNTDRDQSNICLPLLGGENSYFDI